MTAVRSFAAAAAALLVTACAAAPPRSPEPAPEPGMFKIRGGRFTMGRDRGELNEQPAHRVDVDTFAMDRTEVSAAEFAEFLSANGDAGERYFTPDDHATVALLPGESPGTVVFAPRPGLERHPANNVSWEGADAYCRWRGKRLPTEAEWEKAARGTDRRLFPWGDEDPAPGFVRFGRTWADEGFGTLVPVDALPEGASPYGLLNLSGNVLEWVNDWYRQNLLDFCHPEGERNLWLVRAIAGREDEGSGQPVLPPCPEHAEGRDCDRLRQAPPRDNPVGPANGSFKVLRGGSWRDTREQDLGVTHRFWLSPEQRFPHTGFRCAKDVAEARADATR